MRYVYSSELYHFGVPGMRWGHRKPITSETYSRKVKKIRKLETKANKLSSKSAELNYKAKSRFASSQRLLFNPAIRKEIMSRVAYRTDKKAAKMARDADRAKRKGVKIYKRLEKRMANVTISDFNQEDLAYARKFAARYIV